MDSEFGMVYIDDNHLIESYALMSCNIRFNPTLFMQELGVSNRTQPYPPGKLVVLSSASTKELVNNGFLDWETIHLFDMQNGWF